MDCDEPARTLNDEKATRRKSCMERALHGLLHSMSNSVSHNASSFAKWLVVSCLPVPVGLRVCGSSGLVDVSTKARSIPDTLSLSAVSESLFESILKDGAE